jgi:hypothetical protein
VTVEVAEDVPVVGSMWVSASEVLGGEARLLELGQDKFAIAESRLTPDMTMGRKGMRRNIVQTCRKELNEKK